ncbi:MAG: GNAT family N-acetyltransferase [Chloroflexi bacterium]|nr:GNAT family N-acetyltransferase [Chloroflexota bacterium]
MELTLYRDESGFTALQNEWNDLLRRSRSDTIFLTWEWQTIWWRYVGASRGPLYLLAARDAGRLIGILPLYLSDDSGQRTLQVVGCIEVSDYLDLIIEAGKEEPVYAAFLAWLTGHPERSAAESKDETPAWDLVDLCNQPVASPAHTRLAEMARESGWIVEVFQEDVCPVITLPAEYARPPSDDPQQGALQLWEAYLESLDKKERHEIRRKLRRLEREAPEARVRLVTGGPELDAAMADFIALHRLSSQAKDAFMTDEMQGFFRAIAAALAERGWLQLSTLEIAGRPAASYFCFDYANQILVYNSGYDPQASPQLSPGWVLLARLIQDAIAQGRTRFDFLQGNEDYKHRFGGVDEPVYRTWIRKP